MMIVDWRLLLLLVALGTLLLTFLLIIQDPTRAYCRSLLSKLLAYLPLAWQRWLQAYAKSQDAFIEPVDVLLRQLAAAIVISICLVLPLPGVVRLAILGGVMLLLLKRRNSRRLQLRRFSQQWPACLDMLAMLLHAGLSFRAALHALTALQGDAIALVQLRMLHQQLQAGIRIEEGLAELKLRMPHSLTNVFVAAVLQAQFTGGTLAATLSAQAEQARTEQQLEAEKLAQEIGVKLLLPLVTCFFPVSFLLILGPIFIGYMQSQ
ncbi:type II secretion system F family protein [Pseudidiomarina sp. E22-M8]|uniref:type II secretion system F family protein n=1 Tax=Pseudidiomarina sp. E22-M8 TaxID=3424768 RepID=UPI00403CB316